MSQSEIKIVLPTTTGMQFLNLSDVLYFESDNIYCVLHFIGGKSMTILCSIKCLEERVCDNELIRIHKKYIVSIGKINSYSKSDGGFVVLQGDVQLPVSRLRKDQFQKIVLKQ